MQQIIWAIIICALWWALAAGFSRYRRQTEAYSTWMDYKSELPSWVKLTENLILLFLWSVLMVASVLGLYTAYQRLHPTAHATSLSIVLFTLSSAIASWPPAALVANQISLLIPPIRNANLRAMVAVGSVSFGSANRGLIIMALMLIPLTAIQAAIALLETWAG